MAEKNDDHKRANTKSFFDIVGNLINLAINLEDEKREERREGEITDPSGRFKAGFSFSVRTGLSDLSDLTGLQEQKEIPRKKRELKTIVDEEIQPHADVFNEEDQIVVIIEIPGVEEEDIHIELNGDILTLSTPNEPRKYMKEIILPANVDASTVRSKYRHGVLEIRMGKKLHG
jgi:Molecular chaperone (small heat shock protein)